MSRELRRTLLELRDAKPLDVFATGKSSISECFVFPSKTGGVLDPDNTIPDRFLLTLEAACIRAIRFHNLRHTFWATVIAASAPLDVSEEQMAHASIQITVDTYGQLVSGVGERSMDRVDEKSKSASICN